MKVVIGKYKPWVGPYQIANVLRKVGVSKDRCNMIGEWLSETPVGDLCQWIYDKNKRNIKVRIDPWDTYNMDITLAPIVIPMLKQLKENKHGIPCHSFPEGAEYNDENGNPTDEAMILAEKNWNEILDKMIFAWESKTFDWEDQFWKVRPEIDLDKRPEDEGKCCVPVRWKVEGECDWEGRKAYEARIQEGFELFGKHLQSLWD